MTECNTQQDLCAFYRGDTIPFNFNFKDMNGDPIDITNMTLTFSMKEDPDDDTFILQESITFPDIQDSRDGIGSMKILPDKTETLEPDVSYYYDFQLKTTSNDIFTVGAGKVKVLYDITT